MPHQLIAMEDNSIIIEVSTPDSVEDNYRIAKGDNQMNTLWVFGDSFASDKNGIITIIKETNGNVP